MSDSDNTSDIENDIRELVAEILEMDPAEILSDAHFVQDLGMDSMMALEILAGIEKNIALPYRKKLCQSSLTLTRQQQLLQKFLKIKTSN